MFLANSANFVESNTLKEKELRIPIEPFPAVEYV